MDLTVQTLVNWGFKTLPRIVYLVDDGELTPNSIVNSSPQGENGEIGRAISGAAVLEYMKTIPVKWPETNIIINNDEDDLEPSELEEPQEIPFWHPSH